MIRLSSLTLGITYLVFGGWATLIGAFLASVTISPCVLGGPSCDGLGAALTYNLFFGRLPLEFVARLARIAPVILLTIGALSLYMAYLLLRHFFARDQLSTVAINLGFSSLILLFILFLWLLAGRIYPWLDYVDAGCITDDISLCPDDARTELTSAYRRGLSISRTSSLFFGFWVIVWTIALNFTADVPRSLQKTYQKKYHCDECGRINLQDDRPPTCIFCQRYFQIRTQESPIVFDLSTNRDDQLTVAFNIYPEPIGVRYPVVTFTWDNVFELPQPPHEQGWTFRQERRFLEASGPEFMSQTKAIELVFMVNESYGKKQRKPVSSYHVVATGRSDDSIHRPATECRIIITRTQKWYEKTGQQLLDRVQRTTGSLHKSLRIVGQRGLIHIRSMCKKLSDRFRRSTTTEQTGQAEETGDEQV